ncbi:hypothetical protein [Archangium sp.]|uniref:hypothetical protein n=1 Tax=Archangium sp. TaxID=1872627 RepID=UPI0038D45383
MSAHIYKKHSKTKAALLRRLGDLAVHEFGHTLGFPHCEQKGCVMSDAKGKALESADQSSGRYCAKCLETLSPEVRALVAQPSPSQEASQEASQGFTRDVVATSKDWIRQTTDAVLNTNKSRPADNSYIAPHTNLEGYRPCTPRRQSIQVARQSMEARQAVTQGARPRRRQPRRTRPRSTPR